MPGVLSPTSLGYVSNQQVKNEVLKLSMPKSLKRLVMILWSIPLIWAIGGERILVPALLIAAYFKTYPLTAEWNLKIRKPIQWLVLFLIAYIFSILQVSGEQRLITFLWDFTLYASFACVIVLIMKEVRSAEQVSTVLWGLMIFMFICQVIGSTYLVLGPWQYNSLIGSLLPDSIKSTLVGKNILLRSVGKELWLLGVDDRLKSIFSASIHFGAALMLVVPVCIYFIGNSSGGRKAFAILALIGTIFFMVYSQSRTALVLTAVSLPFSYLLMELVRNRRITRSGLFGIFLVLFIAALPFVALLWEPVQAFITDFFLGTRQASFETRFAVYSQTFEGVLADPLFGHGTQTTVPGLEVPLGSHNWYLGSLYKQGLLGFLPLITFLFSVATISLGNMFRFSQDKKLRMQAAIVFTAYLSYLPLAMTIEPIVDIMHLTVLAIIIGLILAIDQIAKRARDIPVAA